MNEFGYVERCSDPADAARCGYLTAHGHVAMVAIREAVAELEARWEQKLGVDDFAKLRELLTELNAVTSRTSAAPTA